MQALLTVLAPFWNLLAPMLATAICGLLIKLGLKIHAYVAQSHKFAALAVVTDSIDTALQAAVKAAGGAMPPSAATVAAATAAAKASILAAIPDAETAFDQTIDTLVATYMTAASGVTAPPAK